MRQFLTLLLMVAGLTCGAVRAAEVVSILDPDAAAIRSVIEAQLAAFEQGDAEGAFRFASPGIRRSFETPDGFLTMVRQGYPVVLRPRTVRFLPPRLVDNEPIQIVEMSDRDGQVWMAIYRLQKQPDGTWLIDGCALVPGRDAAADAGPGGKKVFVVGV